jgi:pimeloyl-ACP methyl ester carboxylesterase
VQVYDTHSGAQFQITKTGPAAGPMVILIHGSLDRSSGMARLARATEHFRQVVRFDRRGYNDRWEHPGPLTVAGNVDDIEAIIGSETAILIGHSYGGQVALTAASRFPDRVVGVSTYETPLSWMTWWPTNTAGARGVLAGHQRAAEEFMIRMIGQQRWDALPERTKTERRREGRALVEELSALRLGPSWEPADIHCPVICGIGSHAPPHQQKAVAWLVDNLESASSTVIYDAHHGAHMSHPKEMYEQLIKPHIDATGTFTEIS